MKNEPNYGLTPFLVFEGGISKFGLALSVNKQKIRIDKRWTT